MNLIKTKLRGKMLKEKVKQLNAKYGLVDSLLLVLRQEPHCGL